MEFKSFMEALKGKQHKIDKNKNNKIDAHDFELLRKEETEELDEATVKTQKYEGGKVMTVHHGASHSYPLHPEHQEAIRNLKHGEKTSFKDETGAKVNVHRDVQDVHFTSNKTSTKTTVPYSHFSEETEELDEIHRMKTKLNKLDDVSNKSVARQKLSNLMKSGKARGALIANKMRTLNMGDDIDQEDLDALHEVLSKDAKAGDWISDFVHSTNPKFDGKSKKERINMALGAYYDTHKKKDGISEQAPVAPVPDRKYIKGTPEHKAYKATKKPINGMPTNVKEEAEELDEKSDQAKQNKTMKNMMDASRGARYKLNNPVPDAEPEHKTAQAHNKAIGRALRNEAQMTTTKDKSGKLVSFKYEGDWKKITKADAKKDPAGKVANMAGQAMQKMKNVSEEKDEQEYGYEGDMAMNQLSTLIRCAEMIKDTLKPDTDLPEWVQSKITLASDYIVTAADYLHSELEEGYYEKPASAYRRKGDEVGGGSSKAVSVKVNHAGDEPHEEKWEPVKKVKKPVAEAVQKVDIPAYLRKAKGDTPLKMDDLKRKDTLSDAENLKRNRGVKESFDDEGNLISNKVSYKEFMLEYTPGPGGVTQIKGRSYGANYSDPEGADDADDNKPMKPAAEKRGRGRPAGAKSGARKITGTSKLMNK
jgi:hypothetical protein